MTEALTLHPHVIQGDDGARVPAEWGRLAVPEVRAKPGSRSIEIAFLRLKTECARPRAPVIYLAGGPGSSGIAGGIRRLSRFRRWAKERDVILLDQRAVNHSRPELTHPFGYDLPFQHIGILSLEFHVDKLSRPLL